MKKTDYIFILGIFLVCLTAFLAYKYNPDYKNAVKTPGTASDSLEVNPSGLCPVCGSINTISEGLYYFKEEAFDSTLTWGIPYKQFRKIYCSKCGIGRLMDYESIKDLGLLNESILKNTEPRQRVLTGLIVAKYETESKKHNIDWEMFVNDYDYIPELYILWDPYSEIQSDKFYKFIGVK